MMFLHEDSEARAIAQKRDHDLDTMKTALFVTGVHVTPKETVAKGFLPAVRQKQEQRAATIHKALTQRAPRSDVVPFKKASPAPQLPPPSGPRPETRLPLAAKAEGYKGPSSYYELSKVKQPAATKRMPGSGTLLLQKLRLKN